MIDNIIQSVTEKLSSLPYIETRVIGTGTTDSRQITNLRTCPYDPVPMTLRDEQKVILHYPFTCLVLILLLHKWHVAQLS